MQYGFTAWGSTWSGDDLTMRLGLERDGGAEPEDGARLQAVASDLMGNVTPEAYEGVVVVGSRCG